MLRVGSSGNGGVLVGRTQVLGHALWRASGLVPEIVRHLEDGSIVDFSHWYLQAEGGGS